MRRARAALVAALGAVAVLFVLQATNTRLLVSWHGFLHSAIANRFPSTLPPENPFFAGEPLPYYWFYQSLAAGLGAALNLDLIRAFQFLILLSLAGVVVAGAALGRSAFKSVGIGLLAAYLALAGANPLGPAIAAAKFVARHQPILNGTPPQAVTQAVFVTNDQADEWLTHPLLPALYVGSDWRYGQNTVWFFDISSRAPAIAALMWALVLFTRARNHTNMILLVVAGALLSALNPVVGLPVAATLTVASALLAFLPRVGIPAADARELLKGAVALTVGAVLAVPTYLHLFGGQGGWALTRPSTGVLKWTSLSLSFFPIAALAIYGALRAPASIRSVVRATALAGIALLGAAFLFDVETLRRLEGGNEHNLTNAALCVLAVPAVAWILPGQNGPRGFRHPAILVFLIFLPTTLLTIASYVGSPAIPIAFEGRTLVRLPRDGPLNNFYGWIRQSTPRDAVFIVDPDAPVKMSGNVSELPAFAARTLFVDLPGYMTDAHRDAAYRRALSTTATSGDDLTTEQHTYLLGLERPMYLVSYRADSANLLRALEQRHGAPAFRDGFVAVFIFQPNRLAARVASTAQTR